MRPIRAGNLANNRTSDKYSYALTVDSFTEYTYPNGHAGVYPLDTNAHGILVRRPGDYKSRPRYG